MGQAQPLADWCWALSAVHAQMRPCSYIELRVWRCGTNRRAHYSDMPRTSGTHRNTWTDGFGCRPTMLAEYHHCQHLISKQWMIQQFNNIAVSLLFLTWMWIPSKRRRSVVYHFVLSNCVFVLQRVIFILTNRLETNSYELNLLGGRLISC